MSLLSKAFSVVSSRARLFLGYLLIGVAVAALGFGLTTYLQNGVLQRKVTSLAKDLGSTDASLKQVVDVNKDQQASIDALKALRERDASAIDGLQTKLERDGNEAADLREQINQLERNNAAAKALLDRDVPPDLRCLLDGTPCPGAGNPNAH